MDNIFEILIYLFIIFSIFSPLFKKKKPPEVPKQRDESERIPVSREVNTEQEEYDILKEIESLFKTDTTVERTSASQGTSAEQKTESAQRQKTAIERAAERARKSVRTVRKDDYTSQQAESEQKYTDWNRKVKVDDAVSRKAAQFEEMMRRRRTTVRDETVTHLLSKMKDPQSLREFIIFSEIINKPKFLRR